MNNENNNNNNGTILGSINNNEIPNQVPTNGVENLGVVDNNVNPVNNANNIGLDNPTPIPEPLSVDANPIPANQMPQNPPVNSSDSITPMNNVNPMPAQPQNPPISPQQMINNSVPNGPAPAYTNPQAINSNFGYESNNAIGSNPPLSFQPEKEPKKKTNNKIIFIVIIIVALALVGFGTYYILNYTNILNKNSANVNIKTLDPKINLGDELSTKLSDYATITGTDAKNCSLNTMNVNISEPGVYEYTVTCGEMHRNGKITIVDNSELKVDLNTVYKTKGENLEASEFAKSGSDVKLEFVNSSEIQDYLSGNSGTYSVKLKATEGTKSNEVEGKLVILDHELKGFLICTSKEQNIENNTIKMSDGEKFAIVADGTNNVFGNFAQEVHIFTFNNTSDYDELLEKYNKGEEISINDITGEVSFNDDEKSITIANDKSVDDLTTEYGAETLKTYSSIRTHFINNLGYTCKFSK